MCDAALLGPEGEIPGEIAVSEKELWLIHTVLPLMGTPIIDVDGSVIGLVTQGAGTLFDSLLNDIKSFLKGNTVGFEKGGCCTLLSLSNSVQIEPFLIPKEDSSDQELSEARQQGLADGQAFASKQPVPKDVTKTALQRIEEFGPVLHEKYKAYLGEFVNGACRNKGKYIHGK